MGQRPQILDQFTSIEYSIDVSSLYISQELKQKLVRAAQRRGYRVERGPNSQLQDYLNYLLTLDEREPRTDSPSTWQRAVGLLATENPAPTDQDVEQILEQRRLEL